MTIADDSPRGSDPGAEAARGPLDAADGVQRVMGDHALYLRMLRRFCDDYAEGTAPIRRSLDGGDLRLARRLAHNLKGASGMISAAAVHRQAGLLEAALRVSCPTNQSDSLDTLDRALAALSRAIEPLLAEAVTPAVSPEAAAPEPVRALLLAQLADLLDRGDGAALDLLEQSAESLRAALGAAQFRAVAQAANEFDFEGALTALGRAGKGTAAGL
jgi:HPt (histidine-containing phosphotransfer) domain-containing protein